MSKRIIDEIEGVLSGQPIQSEQTPVTPSNGGGSSVGAPTIPANLLSNEVRGQQQQEQERQRNNQNVLNTGTGVYQTISSRQTNLDLRNGGRGKQRYTITINLVGETQSCILLVNQTQQFNIKSGYNIYEVDSGDIVSVSSSNVKEYTLKSLVLIDDTGVQEERIPEGKISVGKNATIEKIDSVTELQNKQVALSIPPTIDPVLQKGIEINTPNLGSTTSNNKVQPPKSTFGSYTITKNIGLVATTELIGVVDSKKPIVFLQNKNDMVYDLAKGDSNYEIILIHKNNPTSFTVNVNGRDYIYKTSDMPADMVAQGFAQIFIQKDIFAVLGIGKLNLTITPKIESGRSIIAGTSLNSIIKVTNSNTESGDRDVVEQTTNLPDITTIRYPKLIKAADYSGLDVNFEISWDSVDTEYIKIFKGNSEKFIEGGPNGTIKLNFKELVKLDTQIDSETDKAVSVNLKLIPYKKLKEKVLEGRPELITISLDKANITIPRTTAINRLADAFACQLDVNLFTDDTSKYLTHLLHINPTYVIANWVGNNGSLILKLYEPLPTSIQPNQLVWISKMQSTPIVNTISITGQSMMYCPPLKGPNFSIEQNSGLGYKYFDDLIASGSVTSADIVGRYLEKVGISEEDLNIQYANDSNYTFENFTHFSSAQERISNFFYKIQLLESYVEQFNNFTITENGVNIMLTQDGFQLVTESGLIITAPFVNTYVPTSLLPTTKVIVEKIQAIQRGFDGFEKFLYKSSHILAYPKIQTPYYPSNPVTNLPLYFLESTTNSTVVSWLEAALSYAQQYDKLNPNYLNNNIPEFIRADIDNDDFVVFMDMIGQHFDVLRTYINGLSRIRNQSENAEMGIPNELVWHLLKSLGWDGIRAFDSQFLWEYAFGLNKDGSTKYGMSLEDANNQLWRRLLNNLPYILKHKGTSRAFKAVMACYGVPNSMLTIMEFGGPKDPSSNRATTKFTFEDITAAIHLEQSASIIVPWKSGNYVNGWGSSYPQALEFRFKPEVVKTTRIISAPQFSVDIIQTTGSFARLDLVFGEGSTEPYIQDITTEMSQSGLFYYYTSSISSSFGVFPSGSGLYSGSIGPYVSGDMNGVYVLGPTQYTSSLDFPLSTENYSSILVNKHQYAGFDGMYEVLLRTTDGQRVTTAVSMSFRTDSRFWDSGSQIIIGNDFIGEMDEVRLWTEPLSRSKFENHALFPDAINGNRLESSTEDLLLRLDFEYPKDRVLDSSILNVAISDAYVTPYVSASNFYSASTYPFQYVPYERTVTADVPATGISYANKIRLEEIYDKNGNDISGGLMLSHRVRMTKKAFDNAPADSNRIGIFFSPTKEVNMDILKAFGEFSIDNYLGDYSDEYKDSYSELKKLRNYYFKRLNRNINEYINLVRLINKSLFEVLETLTPARAKVSKGLLIEPHYLERSKTKWDKPTSLRNDFETEYRLGDNIDIQLSNIGLDMNLTSSFDNTIYTLSSEYNSYLTEINQSGSAVLISDIPSYTSLIDYDTNELLQATAPMYAVSINTNTADSTLIGEADAFGSEQIGMNPNSLANKGFGLYAERGTGIYKYYDIFGNYTSSRQNMYVVKEQYQKNISTQTGGWPTIGSSAGDTVVYENVLNTFYRFNVSLLPFSGSITLGNNIVEVTTINGYLPTHYKFVNNLSKGLRLSFFDGSKQTQLTTPDGLPPVETFTTNPNILRVASTGRGSGEPILQVD